MRIVIFDCETCQYEAADPAEEQERQRAEREGMPMPEIKKKKHTTNFVSARVVIKFNVSFYEHQRIRFALIALRRAI